ncbi:hypothetical protein HYH03_018787 [Edaphochlamys debaryana]|uniref:Cysteine protease n=1 Tax=Edaphochlamys debaryana TaxID=47281 RepID=A0A835XGC3_9CHLO|nr:hypothetical protein HYH03_018787 [Edaphochlamys debaryana]|eukprot:KAG2482273.1 hypothetical protein HYH03_018787 [Edaphochlamys debaryana]
MSQALSLRKLADMMHGATSLSQHPAWLLGTYYGVWDQNTDAKALDAESLEAMLSDFRSRLWMTYRKDFPALGPSMLTSDVGWGCTIRSGQMLLAEAVARVALGRGWTRGPASMEAVQPVVELFLDHPDCPLSIHRICAAGVAAGIVPGRWVGPWMLCKGLEALFAQLGPARPMGLHLHVACGSGGGAPELDITALRARMTAAIAAAASATTAAAIASGSGSGQSAGAGGGLGSRRTANGERGTAGACSGGAQARAGEGQQQPAAAAGPGRPVGSSNGLETAAATGERGEAGLASGAGSSGHEREAGSEAETEAGARAGPTAQAEAEANGATGELSSKGRAGACCQGSCEPPADKGGGAEGGGGGHSTMACNGNGHTHANANGHTPSGSGQQRAAGPPAVASWGGDTAHDNGRGAGCGSSGSPNQQGSVLILVPLTLGMDKLNPVYHPQLQALLSWPQTVGIVGGRPSASLFLCGVQDASFLYLDPHEAQPAARPPAPTHAPAHGPAASSASAAPAATATAAGVAANGGGAEGVGAGPGLGLGAGVVSSYFCEVVRLLPASSLDPSMALGFLCRGAGELEDLFSRLEALAAEHSSAPLMTLATGGGCGGGEGGSEDFEEPADGPAGAEQQLEEWELV